VARATDFQGATGTSAAVSITVANQPPQVLSATLSSAPREYSDVPLAVAEVLTLDPEGDPVSYAYQWQLSSDAVNFTDLAGAISATIETVWKGVTGSAPKVNYTYTRFPLTYFPTTIGNSS
jgi:hypothetical protein